MKIQLNSRRSVGALLVALAAVCALAYNVGRVQAQDDLSRRDGDIAARTAGNFALTRDVAGRVPSNLGLQLMQSQKLIEGQRKLIQQNARIIQLLEAQAKSKKK